MKKKTKNIYVAQPSLPKLEEFIPFLEEMWESKSLSNGGKFHQQLEKELATFLGVKHVSLFANGTLALLTALQALKITGEVITTPYSYVATTNSIVWNNLTPVFVDVEPDFGNIDPKKIEEAITPKTTAILPVHVYGNPCYVDQIQEIADNHGLKVIYDAAHAFGNNYKGNSILNHGDLSTLSFHSTKVFNTMEGGAIISHDEKTKKQVDFLKNFGYSNETTIMAPGINSKMNEMQASLGLIQLKHHKSNIEKRQKIAQVYRSELQHVPGISILPEYSGLDNYNYSYFPIFVNEEKYNKTRDELYFYLQKNGIYGRRYFYPLISQFSIYCELLSSKPENLPVAEDFAKKVICLPIYSDLEINIVKKISKIIQF